MNSSLVKTGEKNMHGQPCLKGRQNLSCTFVFLSHKAIFPLHTSAKLITGHQLCLFYIANASRPNLPSIGFKSVQLNAEGL